VCAAIAGQRWTTRRNFRRSGDLTEDGLRDTEEAVQKLTDRFVKSVDDHVERKEAEVMKV
jgi:ribosome recycling factor